MRKMRRDWDQRARENARYYVDAGQDRRSDQEFYESGQVTLEEDILNDLANICPGMDPKDMRVLEIGCGAGRVTRALAGLFGQGAVQGSSVVKAEPDDTWVGVPFSERDAREMAQRCGFELRYQSGGESQYYWLWYFKKPGPDSRGPKLRRPGSTRVSAAPYGGRPNTSSSCPKLPGVPWGP